MTGQTAYWIPRPTPPREGAQLTLDQPGELPPPQCTRCGGVGTHYLTCPGLRLPAGYRLSEDLGLEYGCGLPTVSGPDHPDWPRPPRH